MSRRRRLTPLLVMTLSASSLVTRAAIAQGVAPPPAAPSGIAPPSGSSGAAPADAPAAPPATATPPSAAPPSEPAASPSARPPLLSPSSSGPGSVAGAGADTASAPLVDPARDQQALATQGMERPHAGDVAANPQEVFSDDWWGHARPVLELHGYFRTRAELFHNLYLNRHSSSLQGNDPQFLWPIPLDQSYGSVDATNPGGGANVSVCGPNANQNCYDKTESGANVRLRLDPEIHISDNLRIATQIDLLDNLVLGSTPNAYAMQPSAGGGYTSAGYNPYAPLGFLSTTQGPPTAGVNSWTNSIAVKRVWAEYMTPVGQLRFGRMPSHWGLGMVDNGGDGIDSDYQTTTDRIMFITGLKSMDLYAGGAWDFVSTGPTATPGSATASAYNIYGGQPYNDCNLCNVNEWAAFVAHRTNAELQRLALARGEVVINGGLYSKFRSQQLDVAAGTTPQTVNSSSGSLNNGLDVRQAWAFTPDVWVQALWRKLRFEAEFAMIYGEMGVLDATGKTTDVQNSVDIRQFGLATQTEFRAIDDKLDLQFGFGWASGDPWAYNGTSSAGALNPGNNLPREFNVYGPMSTFAFHPDYRVDLIFYRNILTRVEGSYYFRPSVDYDFIRHSDGEKLGAGAAIIWSRASQFVQTPGHASDLGVELDAQVYYQSKDGSLNDDPTRVGGFYSMLQYGVFFPLGGLSYLSPKSGVDASLSAAQTVRLFLGVAF